jgi:L-alanine-DL-glutamate epimerase-like enolase superfamily enzyme
MIAIGGYYGENADLAAEVAELRELGLAGLKLKVGGLEPEQDAARAHAAREAGGAEFILAADANQAWTPEQAVRFARLAEDCDLVWFEEPCRWAQRPARDARRPLPRGRPDLRGPERALR